MDRRDYAFTPPDGPQALPTNRFWWYAVVFALVCFLIAVDTAPASQPEDEWAGDSCAESDAGCP